MSWLRVGTGLCAAWLGAAQADDGLQWQTLAPMPIGVQKSIRLHRGRIVVAGGLSSELPAANGHLSDALQIYEPREGRWSLGPPLPEGRHHAQLLSQGDTLYLIGGFVRCAGGELVRQPRSAGAEDGATQWQRLAELPEALTETGGICAGRGAASGQRPQPARQANAQWGDHAMSTRTGSSTPHTAAAAAGRRPGAQEQRRRRGL